VYTFWLDEDGSLTQVGEPVKCKNPTFLCSSPDGKYLYAGNEIGNFLNEE
jgi:6-phosphogluconolactonase (cycloisomerase 2 family)